MTMFSLSSSLSRAGQVGMGQGWGCIQRLINFPERDFANRHMPSTCCFSYTGPSWCTLKKVIKFKSTVSQTNSQTQRGNREEWGMSFDDQKDPGQVQLPRTQDRGG